MKLRCLLFVSVVMLSGCDQAEDPVPPSDQGSSGAVITRNAVWQGSVDKCLGSKINMPETCLLETIRTSGGTAAAVDAARYLISHHEEPGYVSGWHQQENVGVASVTYPFRANTNEGTLLIPTLGEPIDADREPDNLSGDAEWQKFRARHPDSQLFAPAEFVRAVKLPQGQQLEFRFPIRTCHACENLGTLTVGYNFDAQGKATGNPILTVNQAQNH